MKYYLSILLCIVFVSCQTRYTKNDKILRAETWLYSSPDSALRLLTSIPHPEKLSKADYAAWCLNYTHALNKLSMDIPSDSLIRISIDYYTNSHLYKQSGTAWYLLGCISKLKSNNKEAIKAFHQAENLLKLTKENKIKALLYFNMGEIYMDDEFYMKAYNSYKKALNFFILSDDLSSQAKIYVRISDICDQMDYPFDSVIYYSGKSMQLFKESGDSNNYYSTVLRQGELYYYRDYKRSKEYYLQGYRFLPAQRCRLAAYLSLIYSKLNQPDSAKIYQQISLADTSKSESENIKYLTAAYVRKGEKNQVTAFDLLEKAYILRDSVFQKDNQSHLSWINKRYDTTQKEKENARLVLNNQTISVVVGILFFIVIVAVVFLFLSYLKKKKNKTYKQQMEVLFMTKHKQNEEKKEMLIAEIKKKIENTLRFNSINSGFINSPESLKSFYDKIIKQSIVNDKEWKCYLYEFNLICEKKFTDLRSIYPELSESDLIVIMLSSLNIDVFNCCNLLKVNPNTIYIRRKTIKKRLNLNAETNLNAWIKQNVMKIDG